MEELQCALRGMLRMIMSIDRFMTYEEVSAAV